MQQLMVLIFGNFIKLYLMKSFSLSKAFKSNTHVVIPDKPRTPIKRILCNTHVRDICIREIFRTIIQGLIKNPT